MPIKINGLVYLTVSDLLERLDVSRQTLWRWRQDGKVPAGQRFRNRHVVFTAQQARKIEAFANQLEPIGNQEDGPLSLFDIEKRGGRG